MGHFQIRKPEPAGETAGVNEMCKGPATKQLKRSGTSV